MHWWRRGAVLGRAVAGEAGRRRTPERAPGWARDAGPAVKRARRTVELLRNAVRPYAWGSRTAIADLLGRPVPTPHPEAELWMGAHPGDPSKLVRADGSEESLLTLLDTDPAHHLGPDCTERWGTRLPFLLKVLAANEPLSLQAHPSAEQAAEGFAREERA